MFIYIIIYLIKILKLQNCTFFIEFAKIQFFFEIKGENGGNFFLATNYTDWHGFFSC